jgi:RHS repeat-associated protein
VDVMRLGRMRLASGGWGLRTASASRVVGVVVVLLVALAVVPAGASAESVCTDTWTRPSEGEWQVASDWSSGKVPSSSDVACVGSGATVTITGGSDVAGVLQGEGGVAVSAGSLELTNTLEGSTIRTLSLSGGTLTGAGTLKVSVLLSWTGGTMSGSGTTVLPSSATGSKEGSGEVFLAQRMLVNEGTFTLSKGLIRMREGAEVKNTGTFVANAGGTVLAAGEGAASLFLNTGTLQKTSSGETYVGVDFENQGTVNALTGEIVFNSSKRTAVLTNGSVLEGTVGFNGPSVTGYAFQAPSGTVRLTSGTLSISGGSTAEIANFVMTGGPVLTGAGMLEVSGSLSWKGGTMSGTGSTVLLSGVSYSKEELTELRIIERTLINEGSFTIAKGLISLEKNAVIENIGTFTANSEGVVLGPLGAKEALFVNEGVFQKTVGSETNVQVPFDNSGIIRELSGKFVFRLPQYSESSIGWGGEENSQESAQCGENESVSCQTGDYSQTQTDFSIGGRGVGLVLSRTYNSQAAVEGIKGPFGYGWSSSFSDHLVGEPTTHSVKLVQAGGSTITFAQGSGEEFTAPAWTQDTLSGTESAGYTLTLPNQTKYKFTGGGRLESVADRNGNATTLSYNGSGNLEIITDPAGRKIKLAYSSEGLVESAEDPMKHVVKYTYESGNLATVTQPGESALRWQFKYDGSHRITELVDGRSGKSTIEYNGSSQVVSQTDPMKRTTSFEYTAFHTTTTNHATGDVTVQYFTSNGMGTSVTNGYGTSSATTETRTFNAADELLSLTDGNEHTTKYQYDSHANRIVMEDPEGNKTKWTYNNTHDIETETKPNGETTIYKRDSHGNPEVIERPAPSSTVQSMSYKYTSHGQVESTADPLKRTWKYEYDNAGDKTAETDPEGNKRTWGYNEDSQETSMVSPRGHVKAGEESKYTTTIERDAQGRSIKVTDPLKHETKYTYDGNGNLETKTDPQGNKTTYTYDADNEKTKVKAPNGIVTETGYDGAGQVISQTDGNKHTTKYERNVLEQVAEVIDPLSRKTTKKYDAAGNPESLTDSLKRTTIYKYDKDDRLSEISYSDGKTPTVKYEYNANSDRTKMEDGTGRTSYEYDQLDRLIKTKDGHGNTTSYEYDLANEQTKITYPNGKNVTHEYDNAGQLKSVTDWLEHTTKFTYSPDNELTTTKFPGTNNEDTYAYEINDAMSEIKMTKGSETLASLVYTRNKDSQVEKVTSKGLPGEEKPAFGYDTNNRLIKGFTTTYKYDEANNPTTIGSTTYKYDSANELEKAEASKATTATYTYDELGERTKTKPTTGPATTYTYDQAGNLTGVTRPKEGETTAIEDTYAYNGDRLRQSQTISGTTTYLAWDLAEKLPLIFNDGTNSYLYGPEGFPTEQISSEGTITYLHHDEQGSTRLLTNMSGASVGTITYGAYGNKVGSTGTFNTPFDFNGQYTDQDTGLIYLRARYYDPVTAQLLSVDPRIEESGEPYTYAHDDPIQNGDPTGRLSEEKHILGGYELIILANRLRALAGDSELLSVAVHNDYLSIPPEEYAKFLLQRAARFEKVAESLEHRKKNDAIGFLVREWFVTLPGTKITLPLKFKEAYCWYKGSDRLRREQFWCGKERWVYLA